MRSVSIISAALAVCVAVPALSRAATATFSYNTIQYSPTLGGTYVSVVPIGNVIQVPAPGYVRFNLAVQVMGNPNAASKSAYNSVVPQPASLGLCYFAQTLTPSNTAGVPVIGAGRRVATVFDLRMGGELAGNVLRGLAGAVLPVNIDGSDATTFDKAVIGVGETALNVYTQQVVQINNTVVLNSTFAPNDVAFIINSSAGNATTPPVYSARVAYPGEVVGPGPLMFLVPEPAGLAVFGVGGVGLLGRRRKG